ncbi:MAG: autotransporter-associated beta strand repeat-containing protein [Planctomycetes bacterium]|nr:autotransporter-associated beta strand repeat-containing protein [Planctomycetota bacterium]
MRYNNSSRSGFNPLSSARHWRSALLGAVMLASLLASGSAAQATIYYWDNNGVTAGFGTAGGTWGTSTNWNTSGTGSPAPAFTSPTATTDDVNFGNGATGLAAGTVSVSGSGQAFGTMIFASGSGAIVVSGGTSLTMAAASTITVNNATDTISTNLVGASSLTKEGTGILLLNYSPNASTYSGGTAVNAGTLSLGGANNGFSTVGAGDLVVGSSGAVTTTASNVLGHTTASNMAKLIVNGGTFSSNNLPMWTKAIDMTAGTINGTGGLDLKFTPTITTFASANSATISTPVVMGVNTTFAVANGGATTDLLVSGAISSTGNLTKSSAGTMGLSGLNTYSGTTAINGTGTLQMSGAGNLGNSGGVGTYSAGISFDSTGLLQYSSSATQTLSGAITGASGGRLTKDTSSSTLTLSGAGANTFNGLTTVSTGVLNLGKTSTTAIGGDLTVSGTGTARLTGTGGNQIANSGNVVVSGGTFDIVAQSETVNGVQLTGGAINGTTGVLTSSTAFDMQAGSASAILAGSVGLNKSTAGTVVLSGADTYNGATNITGGTLIAASNGSLNTASAITVGASGTLNIAANTAGGRTFSNAITLTGGTVLGVMDNVGSGGNTLTTDGVNVIHTFTSGGTLIIPVAVTDNGGVVVGGGGAGGGQTGGATRGGGGGGGGVNALSGTVFSAGSFAAVVGAGGTGVANGNGNNGVQSSIDGHTANGGTGGDRGTSGANGNGGASGAPTSFAGGTQGSGQGGGGGGAGGVGANGAGGGVGGVGLAVSGVTYAKGGNAQDATVIGANTGGGGGGLNSTGASGGSGIVIVQYAYAQSAGTVNLTGNLDVQNTSTLDAYGSGGLLTVGTGTMSGAGGIIIASSNNSGGVIRFDTATKTYNGNTTINSGATLRQGIASALPNGSGKGNLIDNGTFDLNALSATINGLSGSGLVTSSTAGTPVLTVGSNDQTANFSGIIQNGSATSVGLSKTGTGTQTLAGANTYSGVTNVNNGKLLVNGTHIVAGAGVPGLYTVASGATLGGSGSTEADVLLLAGSTLSPGNSPGTWASGSETWNTNSTYLFEIDDAMGTAGAPGAVPGWDLLNIAGSLTLAAGPINVNVTSQLTGGGNTSGDVANFDKYTDYEWLMVDATSTISSYLNVAQFAIVDNFTNDTTGSLSNGSFQVLRGDNPLIGGSDTDLYLYYTAAEIVPEPSTYALGLLGLVGMLGLTRVVRRRRRVEG